MKNVSKNAKDIYDFRNKIINSIKKEMEETKSDSDEKIEQPNFDWLHRPKEELEDLMKKIEDDKDLDGEHRIKNIKTDVLKFLNAIMAGKVNNKKMQRIII